MDKEMWFKFYEEGRYKGLSENDACDFADASVEAYTSLDPA